MKDVASLERLLADVESQNVKRKSSANDREKLRQTICAFANDLPGSAEPGYLFIGADDAGNPTFDRRPCLPASFDDLDLDAFRRNYLPRVVDSGVLRENQRPAEMQLASLRLFDRRARVPTHAGVLAFGHDPLQFLPGAYVQFTRYDGRTRAGP